MQFVPAARPAAGQYSDSTTEDIDAYYNSLSKIPDPEAGDRTPASGP